MHEHMQFAAAHLAIFSSNHEGLQKDLDLGDPVLLDRVSQIQKG